MTDTEFAATAMAVVSASVAALVWWMTRECAAGRILAKRRTFGIRTRHTLVSDEAWMRGHEAALPWTLAGRYLAGLLAVATLVVVGLDREAPFGIALGIAGIVTVLATYVAAVLAISRAASDTDAPAPTTGDVVAPQVGEQD
ncbi:MAG: hypothetical protein JWN68_826 [Nocardioides sp.]|uniref:SdpI family protein n=1 Tax=Nocardioides sp. TaxID=35761 RepID=UPI00260F61F1|nr:SdpI family protein [Nocardioides sp.]MCW2832873.1 hypothetical protein [Nocardioides sp.]